MVNKKILIGSLCMVMIACVIMTYANIGNVEAAQKKVVPYKCFPYTIPISGISVPAKTCIEVKIGPIDIKAQQWVAGIKASEKRFQQDKPFEIFKGDVKAAKVKVFVDLDQPKKRVLWFAETCYYKKVKGPSVEYPLGKWDWVCSKSSPKVLAEW